MFKLENIEMELGSTLFAGAEVYVDSNDKEYTKEMLLAIPGMTEDKLKELIDARKLRRK
jgi:hypothetical protein